MELDHGTSLRLGAADALFAQNDLPTFMAVPFGACSGSEADMRNEPVGAVRQSGDRAGEIGVGRWLALRALQAR